MIRKVIRHVFGSSNVEAADIIIDKDGMRVENKDPSYEKDDYFILSFISQCLNTDEWKHTRHIDVSKAKSKGSPERKEIRRIFDEKIEQRKDEIQALKDAKQILSRWS